MNNVIEVIIKEESDNAYMVFNFENPITIQITSDDQESIKTMFYRILEKVADNQQISFEFKKEKDDLYSEVVEKYVAHLNSEVKSLIENYNDPNVEK